MVTKNPFIQRLADDVPCFCHDRNDNSKHVTFKKCNTMVRGEMRHFATVHHQTLKGRLRIVAKKWLADAWCIQVADHEELRSFDNNPNNPKHHGLIYYVPYDNIGGEYEIALKALRIIMNSSSLPPCS